MAATGPTPVILLPGMGADEQVFARQKRPSSAGPAVR